MNDFPRVRTRLFYSFALGRFSRTDDTGTTLGAQVRLQSETGATRIAESVPVVTHFGFTSRPPEDSDAVAVFLTGDPGSGVVIATNHQTYRLRNLAEGDVALYDQRGAYAWFKPTGLVVDAAGGAVTIQNATSVTIVASDKVRLETPRLEVTGDVIDRCGSNGVTLKALRDAYNAHAHGGVQVGEGSTGPTDHKAA